MTALADIDGALRRPGLAPLDRTRLLAERKRVFERLHNTQARTVDGGPFVYPSPEGPEGEE